MTITKAKKSKKKSGDLSSGDVLAVLILLFFAVLMLGIFTETIGFMFVIFSKICGLSFFIIFLLVPFALAANIDEDIGWLESMGLSSQLIGKVALLCYSALMFTVVGTLGVPESITFIAPFVCPEGYELLPNIGYKEYDMPGVVMTASFDPVCVKDLDPEDIPEELPDDVREALAGIQSTYHPSDGPVLGVITFFYLFYSAILLAIASLVSKITYSGPWYNRHPIISSIIFLILLFTVLLNPDFIQFLADITSNFIELPIT